MDKSMDKLEAWKILTQVAAKFVGNLADHHAVQKALEVLKPEEPKEGPKVEASS